MKKVEYDRKTFFGDSQESKSPTMMYWIMTLVSTLFYIFFLFSRSTELISLCSTGPLYIFVSISGLVALLSLLIFPPKTLGLYARRMFLIAVIIAQFKQEMDYQLLKKFSLSVHSTALFAKFLDGYVCIVTGANSGIGYAISEQLSMLGATVVMTCRDINKCETAASKIRAAVAKVRITQGSDGGIIETAEVDVGDLKSVQQFARSFSKKHRRLDLLILNAGAVPPPGSRTAQGLESCIGSMHVGHAALTKWLQPILLKPVRGIPSAARVVYVGSQAYMMGKFHHSLFSGNGRGDMHGEMTDNCGSCGFMGLLPCCPIGRCPYTNGYARAKLANILHVHELQWRADMESSRRGGSKNRRRLVSSVLHPGAVQTNIHPLFASFLAQMTLRTAEQASRIIMHAILSDSFVPGAYLDAMGRAHDLQGFHGHLLATHIKAHPEAAKLQFTVRNSIDIPSWDLSRWKRESHIEPQSPASANKTREEVAARLWEVTESFIADFSWGKLKK